MNDNLSAFGWCDKHQKQHVFMPGEGRAFNCPACLEDAARIATASADPGCPLKAIYDEHVIGLAKERAAREALAEAEEFFGPLRGIKGDPAIPALRKGEE